MGFCNLTLFPSGSSFGNRGSLGPAGSFDPFSSSRASGFISIA
ncbi:hypothetical protein [Granulicella sp. S190]|nr:hypothetical protein [Granulicella sp. S190]